MPPDSRHILRDIDPYVCLFEGCDQENTLFKTQDDWLGHMQWQHTVVWACQVRGHEFATYDSPDKLEHHIQSEHPASFSELQLPVIIQESASPAPDTFAVLTASLVAESCQADSPANIGHECPICQKKFHQQTSTDVSSGDDDEGDIQNHLLYHLESIALLSLPIDDKRTDSAESNHRQSSANRESLVEDGDDLPAASFSNSPGNPSETDKF